MVAVPAAFAVTTPSLTVAIFVLLLLQVQIWFEFAGVTVLDSVSLLPLNKVAVVLLSFTESGFLPNVFPSLFTVRLLSNDLYKALSTELAPL